MFCSASMPHVPRALRSPSAVGEDAHRTTAGMAALLFGFGRRRGSLLGLSGNDRLPVQDCIPHHAMIATVQVAMQRVEVECDHVSVAHGHVQNCGTTDQTPFPPGLTADHEGCAFAITPFQNDVAAILR